MNINNALICAKDLKSSRDNNIANTRMHMGALVDWVSCYLTLEGSYYQ